MYAVFWAPTAKVFHVRLIRSAESYEPPNYADVVCIDDSVEGYLDALALVVAKAKDEGWRNYQISLEC